MIYISSLSRPDLTKDLQNIHKQIRERKSYDILVIGPKIITTCTIHTCAYILYCTCGQRRPLAQNDDMRCGAIESMPDENLQILRLSTLILVRSAWTRQMANVKKSLLST